MGAHITHLISLNSGMNLLGQYKIETIQKVNKHMKRYQSGNAH